MPEIGIDYSEEVCRAFEEEISYEQHIERMDRIRDEIREPTFWYNRSTRSISLTLEKPKKNLIGGELL